MKSVGLITIHGIINCGSVLQTVATAKMVNQIGYECKVIDYKYPNEYHNSIYKTINPYAKQEQRSLFEKIKLKFYFKLFYKRHLHDKRRKLNKFLSDNLTFTTKYNTKEALVLNPPPFDIYLTGSDQTWNPRYLHEDFSFCLPFAGDKPRLAFSASFGSLTLDKEYMQKIKPLLDKYSYISTRELSGVKLVKEITGKDAVCTCDPTLLLNEKEWSEYCDNTPIIKEKYILCYILSYNSNPYPYADTFIKHIQKSTGLKVVCIDGNQKYWLRYGYKAMLSVGPKDFINLFKHASFVITTSFHGTAFALNFNKDFYSIIKADCNDERQSSILQRVGAAERLIRVGDAMPTIDAIWMKNKEEISQKLDDFRKESLNYLKNALNSCTND